MAVDETKEGDRVAMDILDVTSTMRNQYGLRVGDYARYRQYCARRLARLRKTLKLTQGRQRYNKRELTTEDVTQDSHLLLPLLNAERAWSYAMELKEEVSEDTPRKLFHLRSRLKKAATWSDQLVALCSARADARTALDAEAYASWMKGTLYLEREELDTALHHFSNAKSMYTSLADISNVEQRHNCLERVSEMEPNIRYCEYFQGSRSDGNYDAVTEMASAMSKDDGILKSKVDRVLAESRRKRAKALDHVDWLGKQVGIQKEEIRMLFLKAEEARKERDAVMSSPGRLNTADTSGGVDAEDVLGCVVVAFDNLADALKSEAKEVKLAEEHDEILLLQQYAEYNKRRAQMEQYEFLAEDTWKQLRMHEAGQQVLKRRRKRAKYVDVVGLYENLLECIDGIETTGYTTYSAKGKQELELKRVSYNTYLGFFRAEQDRVSRNLEAAKAGLNACIQATKDLSDDAMQNLYTIAKQRLEAPVEPAPSKPAATPDKVSEEPAKEPTAEPTAGPSEEPAEEPMEEEAPKKSAGGIWSLFGY